MHLTTTLGLLAAAISSATACLQIPIVTYTGPHGQSRQPADTFWGYALLDGTQVCRVDAYNQGQFREDKYICVPFACDPGYKMQLCRQPGDDWHVIWETEYGEQGNFKSESVWVDVLDIDMGARELRLEWGGCEKRNWQETWVTTEDLSDGQ